MSCRFTFTVVSLLASSVALATTEIPGLYDARSTGMGGTGAAFIDSAAAIYNNPAALDQIKTMVVTADVTPMRSQTESPFYGPQYKSEATISPLFFLGGAYRVHERVVVGAAVYPTAGFGSTYEGLEPAPGITMDTEITLGTFELAVPVSVRLLDNLALALMWRGSYAMQSASQPNLDITTGTVTQTDMSLSGMNLAGLAAGLYYKPIPELRLGLLYRSKITFDLEGEVETEGMPAFDAESEFSAPHQLRAGGAVTLLEGKLLLAADVKYTMYKDSNEQMTITVITPMGNMDDTTELQWKNVMSGHLGAEYKVSEMVAARLGYSISPSATPDEYANLAALAPGVLHGIHAGIGLEPTAGLSLDLGIVYGFGKKTIDTATEDNMGPGDYGATFLIGALSATYRM